MQSKIKTKLTVKEFRDSPVDTGRKSNVHKMIRRRPGHLMKVFCTFNLCPVSIRSFKTQKLGSWDFWRIANSVLNKGKSAIPPLFNEPEVLSSASERHLRE